MRDCTFKRGRPMSEQLPMTCRAAAILPATGVDVQQWCSATTAVSTSVKGTTFGARGAAPCYAGNAASAIVTTATAMLGSAVETTLRQSGCKSLPMLKLEVSAIYDSSTSRRSLLIFHIFKNNPYLSDWSLVILQDALGYA